MPPCLRYSLDLRIPLRTPLPPPHLSNPPSIPQSFTTIAPHADIILFRYIQCVEAPVRFLYFEHNTLSITCLLQHSHICPSYVWMSQTWLNAECEMHVLMCEIEEPHDAECLNVSSNQPRSIRPNRAFVPTQREVPRSGDSKCILIARVSVTRHTSLCFQHQQVLERMF